MKESTLKSKCCNSTVHTDCADDGTCYYICDKCGKPCDWTSDYDEYCEDKQMKDIIKEFREKFVIKATTPKFKRYNITNDNFSDVTTIYNEQMPPQEVEAFILKALKDQREEFKKMIPEEKEEKVYCCGDRCSGLYNLPCDAEEHPRPSDGKNRLFKGYNQCREEMIRRLEGLDD